MNTQEKLSYARSRLSLAKAMSDSPEEITKWEEHVAHWKRIECKEMKTACASNSCYPCLVIKQ